MHSQLTYRTCYIFICICKHKANAFVMCVKGDWAFLRSAFLLTSGWSSEHVCWMCSATKGSAGPEMAMTNLSGDWLGTMFEHDPWLTPPALSLLKGFHLKMVAPDTLHCWHIGHGRDFLASVIVHMVETGAFGNGGVPLRLTEATRSLRAYAKAHKLQQVKVPLSRDSLHWHAGMYPELGISKACQVGVVHKWLAHLAGSGFIADPLIATAVWSSHMFLDTVVGGPNFLTEEVASRAHAYGMMYLLSYIRLSSTALEARQQQWFMRPKFHMFHHIVLGVNHRASKRNPHLDAVWMDEDFVGKAMKLLRIIHPARRSERMLQRYLVGLPMQLRPPEGVAV